MRRDEIRVSRRCQVELYAPSVTRSLPSSKTSAGRPFLAEKQLEEQQEVGLEEPRPYQVQAFRQASDS